MGGRGKGGRRGGDKVEERVAGREWRMDGRGGEAAFGPLEFDGRSRRQTAKGLHSFGDVMRQAGAIFSRADTLMQPCERQHTGLLIGCRTHLQPR